MYTGWSPPNLWEEKWVNLIRFHTGTRICLSPECFRIILYRSSELLQGQE